MLVLYNNFIARSLISLEWQKGKEKLSLLLEEGEAGKARLRLLQRGF